MYIVVVGLFVIFLDLYRLKYINDGSNLDFEARDKRVIFAITCIVTFFMLCISSLHIYNKNARKEIIIAVCFLGVLSNLYMTCENNFRNLTFADRNLMIKMNKMDITDKYVIGNYMICFTLYNDYISVGNYCDEMANMVLAHKDMFYFDYSTN